MNVGLLPMEHMHKLLDETTPALRWNGTDDLKEWQKTARAKLFELLGMDKIEAAAVPVTVEVEFDQPAENMEAREIRFRFTTEEDVTVPCHLVIPNNAKGRVPVAITLQGHSTGMHVSLARTKYPGQTEKSYGGDRDFVARCVKEGVAGVALEQRCFGENGGNPNNGNPDCTQAAMRALLLGRTIIGERVWDIMRCIDALSNYFADLVDTDKLICLGNSGGGTATIYAAACDERIKIALPSCAVCRFADSIAAMSHCECNYVPNIGNYFDMGELCAMVAPRDLIVISGIEDSIFPIEGAKKCVAEGARVYKALGVEDKIVHVIGDGGHRYYADPSWPHLREALAKL